MSARTLKVIGGLCAGAAALALALAAMAGLLAGVLQNGMEGAYGTTFYEMVSGGSPITAALNTCHTVIAVCVLAAVATLAGMGACIALLHRRRKKG